MYIVNIFVAIEVSYVSKTMCEINITHGKKRGSAVIGKLPGSSYNKSEKRWLIPVLCIPELNRQGWDCTIDSGVELAYGEQVRRMMHNLRAAGIRFSLKDDKPSLGICGLSDEMRWSIVGLAGRHRYAIERILRQEEAALVQHRSVVRGDRGDAPRFDGQVECYGVAG